MARWIEVLACFLALRVEPSKCDFQTAHFCIYVIRISLAFLFQQDGAFLSRTNRTCNEVGQPGPVEPSSLVCAVINLVRFLSPPQVMQRSVIIEVG